ncbi:MAG TPA: energy transducer TonB [Chitinophagaceae bacterium]|nr:energy transducer TonB [Chitinophagaceae bacterium]
MDTTGPKSIAVTSNKREDTVFEKVDVEASFPGELSGWQQYIIENLNPNTPVLKGAPAGSYTVIVQFIVSKDGSLSSIQALTKHGYGMEAEVMRILRKSPKWLPAQQLGQFVNAYRKQPITFVVQEEKKKKRNL